MTFEYHTGGPFTCADCGGVVLRGEPHYRKAVAKRSEGDTGPSERSDTSEPTGPVDEPEARAERLEHRHFCCRPADCSRLVRNPAGGPVCGGAHVTNVGWWPCSQCGIAHGGHCPPPEAPLPPWPPPGWHDPETGRVPVDRRHEVAVRRLARQRQAERALVADSGVPASRRGPETGRVDSDTLVRSEGPVSPCERVQDARRRA
jgi:hypothetical protein